MVELEQLNIHSSRDIIARHGLTLPELFAFSLEFYKEEKHQFNLSYDQKNQLAAYWRQSTLGPYHPDKLNPGYFDFVGNDRKKAWEALGDISANGAMAGFCNLLETVCPDLVPWIRHKKRERENKIMEKKKEEEAKKKKEAEEELEASKLINIVKRAEEISKQSTKVESSDEEDEMPSLEKNDRRVHTAPPPSNATPPTQPTPPTSEGTPPVASDLKTTVTTPQSEQNGVHNITPAVVEPTKCPELLLPESTNGDLAEDVIDITAVIDMVNESVQEGNEVTDTAPEAVEVNHDVHVNGVMEQDVKTETVNLESDSVIEPQTVPSLETNVVPDTAQEEVASESIEPTATEPMLTGTTDNTVPLGSATESEVRIPESEVSVEESKSGNAEEIQSEIAVGGDTEVEITNNTADEAKDCESKSSVEDEVVKELVSGVVTGAENEVAEEIKSDSATEIGSGEVAAVEPENETSSNVDMSPEVEDKVVKELVSDVVTDAENEVAEEATVDLAEVKAASEHTHAGEDLKPDAVKEAEATAEKAKTEPEDVKADVVEEAKPAPEEDNPVTEAEPVPEETEPATEEVKPAPEEGKVTPEEAKAASEKVEAAPVEAAADVVASDGDTKEASMSQTPETSQSNTEVTSDALNAILTQHFACVLYLKQMKDAGHTLTAEQETYLVQMSAYEDQLKALKSRIVEASHAEASQQPQAASNEDAKPNVSEAVAPEEEITESQVTPAPDETSQESPEETVNTDYELDKDTLLVPSRSATNSQESFSLVSSGESLQVISPDETSKDPEGGVAENAEIILSAELQTEVPESNVTAAPQLETGVETGTAVEAAVEAKVTPVVEAEVTPSVEAEVTPSVELIPESKTEDFLEVAAPPLPQTSETPTNPSTSQPSEEPSQPPPDEQECPTPGSQQDLVAPDNAAALSALAETLQNQLPDANYAPGTPPVETDEDSDGDVRMWSKSGVDLFIAEVSRDSDSVLSVGRGETVTVRIPTYESGTALYWEFATQNYDIGFGASFEWEEEEDATSSQQKVPELRVRREPILPILRRSSHEKVITGSHAFPRGGTYLLMFDNSFSLLRSKTVYYRVFYTR